MKEIKKAAFLLICLCLLSGIFSGNVSADTAEESYKKGLAAMRNKDYETAEREYRKAAEQGHLSAQIDLGLMYVCYNNEEAAKWYRRAAERGSTGAQLILADLLRDDEDSCEGRIRDYGEAIKWYRTAAESANMAHRADAQFCLGEMHEYGLGVSQDLVSAHMWYNFSSMRKDSEAERKKAAAAREHVARKLSPEQLIRAQKMAEEWKPK